MTTTTTRPRFRGAFTALIDSVAGTGEGLLSWVTGRRRTGNAVADLGSWVLGDPGRRSHRAP